MSSSPPTQRGAGRCSLGNQRMSSGGQQGAAPSGGVRGRLREGAQSKPLPKGFGQKMGSGGSQRDSQGAGGGLWGGQAASPVVLRRQTSRRNSLCLVRCLCRAFSRIPRGCSARATASSSSGSRSHHHPLCISARAVPQLSTLPVPPKGVPGVPALTGGHRLLRQLSQVLLLHLLEEFGGGSPSAFGLSWHVLELLQAALAAGAGAVGPGAGVHWRGGEQGSRGVV